MHLHLRLLELTLNVAARRGRGHVEWVKALKALMGALEGYVKAHHASGPAWNAEGAPLSAFQGAARPTRSAGLPGLPPCDLRVI